MKKLVYAIIIVLLVGCSFPINASGFANSNKQTEDTFALTNAILFTKGFANPYEQTYATFTLPYCLPAQWLNQEPVEGNCEADPNGITWCIFVLEDGVIQLTGKNSSGEWKIAKWLDVDSTLMLFICYALCSGFDSFYEDNKDFYICLYSNSGDHRYIYNKASADEFVILIDEWMTEGNLAVPEASMSTDEHAVVLDATGTYFLKKETPDSSCFSEIGYDYENSILFVRFRDSGVAYLYYDVPTDVWNDLSTYADSKGNYFNSNIKGKYSFKRLYN